MPKIWLIVTVAVLALALVLRIIAEDHRKAEYRKTLLDMVDPVNVAKGYDKKGALFLIIAAILMVLLVLSVRWW
jgi:uncharacterized membrane protein